MGTAQIGTDQKTKCRTVRRVGVTAVIFLLLGAIVNIAVAWGCGLFAGDVGRTLWYPIHVRYPPTFGSTVRLESGLPCRSMMAWGNVSQGTVAWTDGIDVRQMSVLPIRPIWSGFLFNTLFYAVILFILIRGPFIARRMIRKHKDRCIKCGYDLRGSEAETCPECGHCVTPAQAGVQ